MSTSTNANTRIGFSTNDIINTLNRIMVGSDRIFNDRMFVSSSSNYPPHNVIKYNDTNYGIEIAVAGFSQDEIDIVVNHNILTIRGEHAKIINDGIDDDIEYLHRGIASRNFMVTFPLAEYVEVSNATIKDGLLKISLEYKIPESLKPRQIEIK